MPFPEEKLRRIDMRRSLLFLVRDSLIDGRRPDVCGLKVGLPYLRAKAQDYFEELGGGIDADLLDNSEGARQTRRLTEQVRITDKRRISDRSFL